MALKLLFLKYPHLYQAMTPSGPLHHRPHGRYRPPQAEGQTSARGPSLGRWRSVSGELGPARPPRPPPSPPEGFIAARSRCPPSHPRPRPEPPRRHSRSRAALLRPLPRHVPSPSSPRQGPASPARPGKAPERRPARAAGGRSGGGGGGSRRRSTAAPQPSPPGPSPEDVLRAPDLHGRPRSLLREGGSAPADSHAPAGR